MGSSRARQRTIVSKKTLKPSCKSSSKRAPWHQKLDMMRKYHELRTSESFYHVWNELTIAATGMEAVPVFFQDATDRVFQKMIIAAFPLEDVGITVPG